MAVHIKLTMLVTTNKKTREENGSSNYFGLGPYIFRGKTKQNTNPLK